MTNHSVPATLADRRPESTKPSANEKAVSQGWEHLIGGYVADVEAARREEALWDLLWDGVQIVAGAVITVVGVGLTPFTGGFSLGLTVLGGSLLVGGVNSAINHVSIAASGEELNLIGNMSNTIGQWYDMNIARPAVESGSWGLELLAGVGSGLGSIVSEAASLNIHETGQSLWTLATDANSRTQLWDQLLTTVGKIGEGDAYTIGEIIGSVIVPGAGAIKFAKPGSILNKLGKIDADGFEVPVKVSRLDMVQSAVDRVRKPAGADAPTVKPGGGVAGVQVRTGWLPERGTPNSFGYDADGVRLPYANHRPDFASDQVNKVWERDRTQQIREIEAGLDGAPPRLPGPDQLWVKDVSGNWKLIEWKQGQPRKNLWDMGHIPEAKYAKLRESYLSGEIV